jgi:hypothetical protein
LSVTDVKNQAVEIADGKQSNINKKITFRMFLGDNHEHQEIVTAFVFEFKFDIILGRNWLKQTAPIPDWFYNSWEIKSIHPKNGNIKIYPVKPEIQKFKSINTLTTHTNSNTSNQNIHVNTNPLISKETQKLDLPAVDYLISANQVARMFKKNQVTECYGVNFLDKVTGNAAAVTPVEDILRL